VGLTPRGADAPPHGGDGLASRPNAQGETGSPEERDSRQIAENKKQPNGPLSTRARAERWSIATDFSNGLRRKRIPSSILSFFPGLFRPRSQEPLDHADLLHPEALIRGAAPQFRLNGQSPTSHCYTLANQFTGGRTAFIARIRIDISTHLLTGRWLSCVLRLIFSKSENHVQRILVREFDRIVFRNNVDIKCL